MSQSDIGIKDVVEGVKELAADPDVVALKAFATVLGKAKWIPKMGWLSGRGDSIKRVLARPEIAELKVKTYEQVKE